MHDNRAVLWVFISAILLASSADFAKCVGSTIRIVPALHLQIGSGASYYAPQFGSKWAVVERTSPDGLYVAQIVESDGEIGYLYVGSVSRKRYRHVLASAFIVVANANGCAWVPNRPHDLVYSSGNEDYGAGLIAIWLSPYDKPLILQHAKSAENEGFDLFGISQNGVNVEYEHFGQNSRDPDQVNHLRLFLRLHWETGKKRPTIVWE